MKQNKPRRRVDMETGSLRRDSAGRRLPAGSFGHQTAVNTSAPNIYHDAFPFFQTFRLQTSHTPQILHFAFPPIFCPAILHPNAQPPPAVRHGVDTLHHQPCGAPSQDTWGERRQLRRHLGRVTQEASECLREAEASGWPAARRCPSLFERNTPSMQSPEQRTSR